MEHYPKWIFSRERWMLIESEEEHPGKGWYESPADIPEEDALDGPTLEDVRAQLEKAGISYDKRWGLNRLIDLLPK